MTVIQLDHFKRFYGLWFMYIKHTRQNERSKNKYDAAQAKKYRDLLEEYDRKLSKLGLEPLFDPDTQKKLF